MGAAIAALSDEALKIAILTAPKNYIDDRERYIAHCSSRWASNLISKLRTPV